MAAIFFERDLKQCAWVPRVKVPLQSMMMHEVGDAEETSRSICERPFAEQGIDTKHLAFCESGLAVYPSSSSSSSSEPGFC